MGDVDLGVSSQLPSLRFEKIVNTIFFVAGEKV